MSRKRARRLHAAAVSMTIGGAVATVLVPAAYSSGAVRATNAAPAATTAICTSAQHPRLAARISRGIARALAGRDSVDGLTVADPRAGLTCALHRRWHFDAASVIKVTIISALLLKEGGPAGLTRRQHDLAWQMITQSNNNAATALWNDVGMTGMQNFLTRAGMRHTELNDAWGLTKLTAQDEMTLLRLLTAPGKVLSTASRRYALWLMANVVSYERWGVPAGAPPDVKVHVKNGWLPYPGSDWHINSIGAFTGHHITYLIAILTSGDPSETYGIETVQAAAEVINKDLASP